MKTILAATLIFVVATSPASAEYTSADDTPAQDTPTNDTSTQDASSPQKPAPKASADRGPETPVKAQLRAYNKRDIEPFLAAYSDDVRVYRYPETLRYEGKAKMRERYSRYFQSLDDLNCEIVSRMICGNVVIDHERVTRTIDGVESVVKAIAIYTVEAGKITEVRFVQN